MQGYVRGKKLFENIVMESVDKEGNPANTNKGRSSKLLERRNRKLCYRFYYYTRIQKFRFDMTIEELSTEFDISPTTIGELLGKLSPLVKEIAEQRLSLQALRKLYPMYTWLPPRG